MADPVIVKANGLRNYECINETTSSIENLAISSLSRWMDSVQSNTTIEKQGFNCELATRSKDWNLQKSYDRYNKQIINHYNLYIAY
jgi:hypothetical protein|uniref:Uncharacterized protein n=1 Tax=Picea glauca TaxID=3330 RepID=A0A117NI15_PICGL|nr:hypothetical protein ABT39_MTgene3814 [Picea glauca]QHR87327.1 hypothetical protein Q903MT_gene1337 [Picea sitchensis]